VLIPGRLLLSGRAQQAPVEGLGDGRRAVADAQLGVDVQQVRLDRRLADEQPGGRLLVPGAGRDQGTGCGAGAGAAAGRRSASAGTLAEMAVPACCPSSCLPRCGSRVPGADSSLAAAGARPHRPGSQNCRGGG